MVMNFSPPNQSENALREQRELERKLKARYVLAIFRFLKSFEYAPHVR
jgi:hypothetical protein